MRRSSFIENLEGERSPLSFMITKFALRQYPKIAARRHIIKINSGPLVSGSLDVKKLQNLFFLIWTKAYPHAGRGYKPHRPPIQYFLARKNRKISSTYHQSAHGSYLYELSIGTYLIPSSLLFSASCLNFSVQTSSIFSRQQKSSGIAPAIGTKESIRL